MSWDPELTQYYRDQAFAEAYEKGSAEGYKKGFAKAEEHVWRTATTNLAKNKSISITEAISLLQVPEQYQQSFLALLEKNEKD